MNFGDEELAPSIFRKASHTEIEPALGINPMVGIGAVVDTCQPILKLRDLPYKLNIARIEIAVDEYESLSRA